MKKGFSMFSYGEDIDLAEKFTLIKKAGYDGVEPVMGNTGYLTCNSTEKQILEIAKIAEETGLQIPSVGVWSLWENNLVSDRNEVRGKAKDIIRRQIEAASILGADTILVVPGYVGCDFVTNPEHIRYDIAYERCVEALNELAPYAEAAKIQIGIENVWNRFLLSPIEVRRLLDSIDSQYVGMYFDVGNVMYIGYPEDWIKILGSYIKKVHVCDFRRSQSGIEAFVDLLAGDVDYPAVMQALQEIGYDDYLTLEMLPNYKQFPDASMYSNKKSLDFIVDRLIDGSAGRGDSSDDK